MVDLIVGFFATSNDNVFPFLFRVKEHISIYVSEILGVKENVQKDSWSKLLFNQKSFGDLLSHGRGFLELVDELETTFFGRWIFP